MAELAGGCNPSHVSPATSKPPQKPPVHSGWLDILDDYNPHCTLYTPLLTLYTPHFTLHNTPYSTLPTLHFTLYTLDFTLHTAHSTHYTTSTLHTLHFNPSGIIKWHRFNFASQALTVKHHHHPSSIDVYSTFPKWPKWNAIHRYDWKGNSQHLHAKIPCLEICCFLANVGFHITSTWMILKVSIHSMHSLTWA